MAAASCHHVRAAGGTVGRVSDPPGAREGPEVGVHTRAREESEADSPRGKGRILQALEVPGGNYPGGSGELLNLGSNVVQRAF